jgi:hypothetical protein
MRLARLGFAGRRADAENATGERIARAPTWPRTRALLRAGAAIGGHAPLFGVTALAFLTLNKRFYNSPVGYDEDFFVWGGWCIRKGLVPYRDFTHFKPPIVFVTHALAQAIFGFENNGFRTFFAAFPLAALLALQASLIARGIGRFIAMATILGIVSLFVNPAWHDDALSDSESIGLSYYVLGLALLLWEGRFTKLTLALGGFFMCCCVLSKEPFLPVVLCTWLGLLWLRGKPGPTRESVLMFGRHSLMGVAVFTLALCLYMVPTGALKAYMTMAVRYSRTYRGPRSYCVALGLFQPSTPMGELREAWDRLRATFLNEKVLGYLAPLASAGAVFAYRRSPGLFTVMVLGCLGALWAATASQCPWPHYYNMSMAGVVFVLVAGVDSMKGPLRESDRRIQGAVSVAAVTIFVLHMYPDVYREAKAEYRRQAWREPVPGVMALIAKVTKPSDRIFTTGPPILYVQADRVSAVRESDILDEFLGSYDGSTDEEKLRPLYRQLVRNEPKVVILDPEHRERKARHDRSLLMPYLADFRYVKVNDNVYVRP